MCACAWRTAAEKVASSSHFNKHTKFGYEVGDRGRNGIGCREGGWEEEKRGAGGEKGGSKWEWECRKGDEREAGVRQGGKKGLQEYGPEADMDGMKEATGGEGRRENASETEDSPQQEFSKFEID